MAFTVQGLDWMSELAVSNLEGATIVVGNGNTEEQPQDAELAGEMTASAQVQEIEYVGRIKLESGEERHRLILRATFDEEVANFEWSERAVRLADGRMIDRVVQDQGRKVSGQIWAVEAALDLRA
jgi:hypothetical protein